MVLTAIFFQMKIFFTFLMGNFKLILVECTPFLQIFTGFNNFFIWMVFCGFKKMKKSKMVAIQNK